jgi:glyoxylase I family protein
MDSMAHPPFKLRGLDHVVLLVRDMSEAQTFYEQVLGCTVDRALPEYGMLQLRAGASLIDLVDIGSHQGEWARPEAEGGRNMDHICIATGPCREQAMRAHLAHHGIAIVEEGIRYGADGDGMSFYICDPSGNQIELKSPIAD